MEAEVMNTKHEVQELKVVNQEAINARDIAKVPAACPGGVGAGTLLRCQGLYDFSWEDGIFYSHIEHQPPTGGLILISVFGGRGRISGSSKPGQPGLQSYKNKIKPNTNHSTEDQLGEH